MIIARALYAYRLARSSRWRITYRLVMAAAVGMLATDSFDTLTYAPGNWFVFSPQTVPATIYTLWYLFVKRQEVGRRAAQIKGKR